MTALAHTSSAAHNATENVRPDVETLLEFATSDGLQPEVDRVASVIRGVKILGLESRNGRTYLPAALARATALYEGAKVNVNHPRGNPSLPRDYQDRLGCLRNVQATAEGVFGDLHFNPRHGVAEQLMWDARHAPENVGLSHNAQARTSRREGMLVVEEILKVNSVDLVADPATTRGLFESSSSPAGDNSDDAAATVVEHLRQTVQEEIAALRERIALLEAAQSQTSPPAASEPPRSKGPTRPSAAPGDIAHWARTLT